MASTSASFRALSARDSGATEDAEGLPLVLATDVGDGDCSLLVSSMAETVDNGVGELECCWLCRLCAAGSQGAISSKHIRRVSISIYNYTSSLMYISSL